MLLSKKLAKEKAKKISLTSATNPKNINKFGDRINSSYEESKDTTHYSVVDKDGNGVSVTYTLVIPLVL